MTRMVDRVSGGSCEPVTAQLVFSGSGSGKSVSAINVLVIPVTAPKGLVTLCVVLSYM